MIQKKGKMMTTIIGTRENGTTFCRKEFKGESMTEQSHKERTNINKIMARARRGIPVPVYDKKATYGDFADLPDYQGCLNRIIQAEQDFNKLPAEVRKRFENDPSKLIEFMSNEDNLEEAIKIGLVEADEPDLPVKVQMVGTEEKGQEGPQQEPATTE
jgi:phage internal scaffolding protein